MSGYPPGVTQRDIDEAAGGMDDWRETKMASDKFILDGKHAVPCGDLMEWARWFQKADKHVAQEMIGNVRVSTVFLGLDHSFGGPVPLLFETMIFGGPHDQYQERYSTWEEAEAGHAKAIALAKGAP